MRIGSFEVSAKLPQVGPARLTLAVILSLAADTLWFWAAEQGLTGLRPSWRILVAGVIPWGVAWVTLLLMERRIARDRVVVAEPLPEPDREAAAR